MRRLLCLRHAKSSWAPAGMADRDRPLNGRGRKAADLMGAYLAEHKLTPDLVLCSPAARTVETCQLIQRAAGVDAKVQLIEGLYDFGGANAVIGSARNLGADAATLMIIGHNPSMQLAVSAMSGRGRMSDLAELGRKYPTAGLAVVDFEIADWSTISPGIGILERFVVPKKLVG